MTWLLILGKVFTFIPGLLSFGQTLIGKHYDAQVAEYQARTGTNRDIAVEAIRAQAAVQEKWWFVAALIPAFALPFVVYTWKVVVYDIVLGLGMTDKIGGTVGWVYTTVVVSVFVHGIADSFRSK